ncbi:MAG: DEAD/DEAH box helicase [Acidimicrobiia bacterium]|nr:DEAD/DEAH box helicase [Acidimicrobiia bacterium]
MREAEQESARDRAVAYARARGYEADAFQIRAMSALDDGRSVVVSAPTGSGKTLVAEYAVDLALASGGRALYTTPLKALSNQKVHDLGELLGPSQVGLLTGDNSVRGTAPVVVMTTEVLRNMLYTDAEAVAQVGVVVLDEVHYLQDPYRGGVWEEVIIHLPRTVQLVCLSATVSNSEEFGAWIETLRGPTDVVVEEHRPVPLEHWVGVESGRAVRLLPLFAPDANGPNPKVVRLERHKGRGGPRAPRRHGVIEQLGRRDLLPAIYFIFSRAGCERAVRQLLGAGVSLTTAKERHRIREALDRSIVGIGDRDLTALGFPELAEGLLCGIAPHHAGMVPAFRELVEELFIAGVVKVTFATETLSLGVNMPARTVVVEKLTKFGGERHEALTPGQYTQLAGRAGRRGTDDVGNAVVLWSPFVFAEQMYELAAARSYLLESSFEPNYNMVANLVARMDLEAARDVVGASFAQFRVDSEVVRLQRKCDELRGAADEYRRKAGESAGAGRKRWELRAKDTERRIEKLQRRAQRRADALGHRFDSICDLLVDLDYLVPSPEGTGRLVPTRKGELLRRLYSEADLVTAEVIEAGLLDSLEPAALAAAVAVLTFEARREGPVEPLPPSKTIRRAISELLDVADRVADIEAERGLDVTRELDDGFAGTAYGWASGCGLDDLLDSAAGGGDFVRNVKQLIDACRQIADATREVGVHVELGRQARRAADLLNRGVVALSSVEDSPGENPAVNGARVAP